MDASSVIDFNYLINVVNWLIDELKKQLLSYPGPVCFR